MGDQSKKLNPEMLAAAVAVVVVLLLAGVIVYGNERLIDTEDENYLLSEALESTQNSLTAANDENARLAEALLAEQERLRQLGEQVGEITGAIGTLEKLAELEPELLQKYSKVYFLNEHYSPERLKNIPEEYLYFEDRPEEVDARMWPFLDDLLEEAEEDGIELYIYSAYRSFGEQSSLKSAYTVSYGSGANQFSADQGYSEHQLGTTVDLITPGVGGTLNNGFSQTETYQWLLDNAHKYGFTLSYPEGNQYYVFEPWHWRFVGEDLARDLKRDNRHFYDLDQRVIDEYLLEIFD